MAKKIIIVGGGIGGAATALALHRVGFDPVVYERTQELKEVGAGIALWANATHILQNCKRNTHFAEFRFTRRCNPGWLHHN